MYFTLSHKILVYADVTHNFQGKIVMTIWSTTNLYRHCNFHFTSLIENKDFLVCFLVKSTYHVEKIMWSCMVSCVLYLYIYIIHYNLSRTKPNVFTKIIYKFYQNMNTIYVYIHSTNHVQKSHVCCVYTYITHYNLSPIKSNIFLIENNFQHF